MSIVKVLALALAAGTMTAPALAETDLSPWQVRGRLIQVAPDESGTLRVGSTRLGGGVEIETQVVPELDITYFFTKNIAAELILGVTPHEVTATNVSAVAGADVDLGEVWLLPPTLTLQYHFNPDGQIKPYIGAGLNFTHFFNEDEGPVADSISYDSSFGGALQIGVDYDLDGVPGGWFLNADLKKIYIQTDVTVDFTTALGAKVDADVEINPLVFGLGAGIRF
jgi:outer membrane protein